MIVDYGNVQNIDGYFFLYHYYTFVTKNGRVERFKNKFYARNDKHAQSIVQHWNTKCTGTCAMYRYELIPRIENFTHRAVDIYNGYVQTRWLLHYDEQMDCLK